MDFRIMAFDETTLEDFQDVILPNVLEELLALDDFTDFGVLAVGAMLDGASIGALIARLLSETQAQILSLYVVPECRRAGVASAMLDGAAAMCFDLFDSVEQWEVPVGICIDYVTDETMEQALESFLGSTGFRVREERPPVYRIMASCESFLSGSGEAHPLPDDAELAEWLEDIISGTGPELAVYAGSEDAPDCILLASDAGDGSYDLISYAPEGCGDAEFTAALKLLLQKLGKDAVVYADAAKNACPDALAQAARYGGEALRHSYAQRRMIIEKG